MDKNQLAQFLKEHESAGIAGLHKRGYAWFKSEWMPRLRLADELLGQDLELIADCWYLVGDVHDFNSAPSQAIQAYQQALHYDEGVDGAYRELAYLNELTGQYTEALTYVEKALDCLPDLAPEEMDEPLQELYEDLLGLKASIQDSLNYSVEPYLTPQNENWNFAEALAREEFDAVVTAVTAQEALTVATLQQLAQAQGALNDYVAYLQTWQRISEQSERLEIGYADWFYLPDAVAQDPAFWALLQQLAPRASTVELNDFYSLDDHYAEDMEAEELLTVVATYHLATLTDDALALGALHDQYPLWEEVQPK